MSDLAQAALISGGIFIVVMLSQFGRRELVTKDLLRPVGMAAAIGWFYLQDMPFRTAGEWDAYGIAVVLGLLFAAGATLATKVERDTVTGRVMTTCGAGFVVVWALAVVLRLGFIWTVENVSWAHDRFGLFMMHHDIQLSVIAPFFVIWALTMVLARVVAIQVRVHALSAEAQRTELVTA